MVDTSLSYNRSNLIGTWELVDHFAYLPHDQSNKVYPMGDDAEAILTYNSDGYMSAQFLISEPESGLDAIIGGKSFVAYAGEYYLKETERGTVVEHRPKISNLPHLVGHLQSRILEIIDSNNYLRLTTVEPINVSGGDRIITVKWRRLPENKARDP
jgi:hypothetical protein